MKKKITIATLNDATSQEVFNQAYRHLLTQNAKSVNKEQNCMYKGENGLECVAGCFIAGDEYAEEIEGSAWPPLSSFSSKHDSLFLKLQTVHDTDEVKDWKSQLEKVATIFNLKIPEL